MSKKTQHSLAFTVRASLISSLGVFLIFALSILSPAPASQLFTTLAQNPKNVSGHEALAQAYLNAGNTFQAKEELAIAKSLPASNVLGATTGFADIEQQIVETPKTLAAKIAYWSDVTREHPTYIDGWIQLYYLYAVDKNGEKQQQALQKIANLDPLVASEIQAH